MDFASATVVSIAGGDQVVDELYTTKSRPFPNPETGKIAVKVINHYGDEVTKVYEILYNA